MREAEGQIQYYKGLISEWESKATSYEERLGLLEKEEGECRTWQYLCEWIWCLFELTWLTVQEHNYTNPNFYWEYYYRSTTCSTNPVYYFVVILAQYFILCDKLNGSRYMTVKMKWRVRHNCISDSSCYYKPLTDIKCSSYMPSSRLGSTSPRYNIPQKFPIIITSRVPIRKKQFGRAMSNWWRK